METREGMGLWNAFSKEIPQSIRKGFVFGLGSDAIAIAFYIPAQIPRVLYMRWELHSIDLSPLPFTLQCSGPTSPLYFFPNKLVRK
jgi:hypothetical protein